MAALELDWTPVATLDRTPVTPRIAIAAVPKAATADTLEPVNDTSERLKVPLCENYSMSYLLTGRGPKFP